MLAFIGIEPHLSCTVQPAPGKNSEKLPKKIKKRS